MDRQEVETMSAMVPPDRSGTLEYMDDVVREHRQYLIRYVNILLRDLDAAETIAQECLLKAYAARAQYREDCSVRTWLTSIALNLVRDHLRSKKKRFWRTVGAAAVDVSEISDRIAGRGSTPEATLIQNELLQCVWTAAEELTEKQRQVFVMRFALDMPFSEIAMSTGMNVSTLKTTLTRSIKAVRLRLGYTPSHRSAPRKRSRECRVL